MICKWCGEAVDPSKGFCGKCGRELPPMSECGGFYQVMPSARLAQQQTPKQPTNQSPNHGQNAMQQTTQLRGNGLNQQQNGGNMNPSRQQRPSAPEKKSNALPALLFIFICVSLLALILSFLFFALTSSRLSKLEEKLAAPPETTEETHFRPTPHTDPVAETEKQPVQTESPSTELPDTEPATETPTTELSDTEDQNPAVEISKLLKQYDVTLDCRWPDELPDEADKSGISLDYAIDASKHADLNSDENAALQEIKGYWVIEKLDNQTFHDNPRYSDWLNELYADAKELNFLVLELYDGEKYDGVKDVANAPFARLYFCAAPDNNQNNQRNILAVIMDTGPNEILPSGSKLEYDWEVVDVTDTDKVSSTVPPFGNPSYIGSTIMRLEASSMNCYAASYTAEAVKEAVKFSCTRKSGGDSSFTVYFEKLPLEMLHDLNSD